MAKPFNIKHKDAVRIKVIQHSNGEVDSQCCKFSVAPELTSFDVLQNLIGRAFDLKRDFQTSYLARDDRLPEACWLPLLSDFDLELAFSRSSEPYLMVKVDLVQPFTNWDVSSLDLPKISLPELPKNTYSNKLPGIFREKMEKTFSIVQKALNWAEEDITPPPTKPPLTDSEFKRMLDSLGTLKDSRELRLRIYSGGVEPSLRRVVWKHLLNVYPDNLTGKERMDFIKEKTQQYYEIRDIWQKHLSNSSKISDEVKYTTNMVRKDVRRTDRHHPYFSGPDDNINTSALYNILTTYALNHPNVGYCQGMSDLASPLLVTMKDEAQAYICFCALMRRLQSNFLIDGDAMTLKFQHLTEGLIYYDYEFFSYLRYHQADDMLFCYRWLLLDLKREFAFDDALLMLEVLWSSLPPNPDPDGLKLVEEPFNPIEREEPISHRQNHYANVCALRRQRSCVSSKECLLAIFNTGIDDINQDGRKLSRTLSQPISNMKFNETCPNFNVQIEEESSSSTPNHVRKIRNLKEFQNLTKSPEKKSDVNGVPERLKDVSVRRCFSDSDADIGLPDFESADIEVWQNPVAISPDEIVSTPEAPLSQSVSTCEEVLETGWQVSVSPGSVPSLPSPDEFGGGNPFLIFLCLTLLLQQRNFIMQRNMDHNELAIHFDKLVRKHNVQKVLLQARKMFEAYLSGTFSKDKKSPTDSTSDQFC